MFPKLEPLFKTKLFKCYETVMQFKDINHVIGLTTHLHQGVLNFKIVSNVRFPLTILTFRVAKFKCPRVLGDQKISEDNQELRPGCPPDYQIFCERIDPKVFIPTNLSSYFSLTNKNSSVRTSTTYIYIIR